MEQQYALHSVVRSPAFRTHRALLPAHMRKRHFVCDQTLRLVPARRLLIPETTLLKHLGELKEKVNQHILEVRTADGRLVDLETMQPGPAAVAPLRPHPRLDSVAYDTPTGQYIPPYVGDDGAMPNVLPQGAKPQLLTQDAATKALDAAADADKSAAAVAPESPAAPDADAELEAAVAAAQEAAMEEPAAPPPQEPVSSEAAGQSARRGKRNRR